MPVIAGCTIETACNYNADATDNDDSCVFEEGCNQWCNGDEGEPQEFDCAFTCDGDAEADECGTCDDNPYNDCVQDCEGAWGGDASEDECGTCDSDSSNDCAQDCAGEWGGGAEYETFYLDFDNDGLGAGSGIEFCNGITLTGWVTNDDDTEPYCSTNNTDECGECGGDDSSCADCAGVANGDAYEDECGTCNGNGQDHRENTAGLSTRMRRHSC